MLYDGDRGVVLQRDKKTYAIAPHLPCGLVSPETLRKIAAVAEKYHATLKCTSAQRIAIIGLKEEDIDAAWADLGEPHNPAKAGHMTGDKVRSVRACPGLEFCKRARQDSLGVGLHLDKKYHGKSLPGKMKLGVSGCPNQCSETCIKDVGLVGGARGWTLYAGGTGGTNPRLAKPLNDEEIPTETALKLVDKIVRFYAKTAQPSERLADVIERIGFTAFKQKLGLK